VIRLLEIIGFKYFGDYFQIENENEENLNFVKSELEFHVRICFDLFLKIKFYSKETFINEQKNSSFSEMSESNGNSQQLKFNQYNIIKKSSIFQVPEKYKIMSVLGSGGYGIVVYAF
jgi:hypothetical protein